MARSRNIKPAFFKNEQIAELDPYGRLLFIGLWCLADRNGLVEYRPKRIKIELFPYDDSLDINGYIPVMERLGLIHVLTDGESDWLYLPTFTKHQNPHHTERTNYPDPKSLNTKDGREITVKQPLSNGDDPADSLLLNPDSLTPDSGEKKGAKAPKKFTPPTVDEVRRYCQERGNNVDPESFIAHYEANGWYRGKTKVKDWKACVITWEKRNATNQQTNQQGRKLSLAERATEARKQFERDNPDA